MIGYNGCDKSSFSPSIDKDSVGGQFQQRNKQMIKEVIIVGDEELPERDTVDGRPCTRVKYNERANVYNTFHDRFIGPFHAVTDDMHELPPLTDRQLVKHNSIKTVSNIVYDDIDHTGGKVVDSRGRVVCDSSTWLAAKSIALMLNAMPEGIREGSALGMLEYHGMSRHVKEDKFAFWCIQVPFVELKENDLKKISHMCYVAPFKWLHAYPPVINNPMSALRFSGHSAALKVLEYIKSDVLEIPSVRQMLTKNVELVKKSGGTYPLWEDARPVLVKFAYNVCS